MYCVCVCTPKIYNRGIGGGGRSEVPEGRYHEKKR